jgi:hypothetical protein
MTLAHSSASAGKPCASCSKFPTYVDYNAHGIPIAAQSHQGHASYARCSCSARHKTDPQCPHSPHCHCHSPCAPSPLFSSPTAPCVTTVTRTRLLACGRLCRAYTPGTHTRKNEDGLLLEFPCNPTRTHSV